MCQIVRQQNKSHTKASLTKLMSDAYTKVSVESTTLLARTDIFPELCYFRAKI